MTVRMAILGAGRIGQVHARALAQIPEAELAAIHDPVLDGALKVAEHTPTAILEIDEILADDSITAVAICTPTSFHADQIEACAKAGKAIFCEKPIALERDRVQQALAVVEQTKTSLMLGFNRRFDLNFQALKQAAEDGSIGAVEQLTIISRDPGLPPAEYIKSSGGIFRDMTIHDFDMARFLLGEEMTSVYATAGALVDPAVRDLGDYDTASVVMTSESGKQITILNSRRASYGYDQRIELHGSKGMIAAENHRPIAVELATEDGFTRPPLHDFFMTRYTAAYQAELAAFAKALTDGTPMQPNGTDGLRALDLALAAEASVISGRAEPVG